MADTITKQLLFDHFAGRLTALQRSRVEEWLKLPINRELYYGWLEEWERLNLQYVVDDQAALQESLHQIAQWENQRTEPAIQPVTAPKILFFWRWTAIAASILVCLLAGLYASRSYLLTRTIETNYGEVRRLTLPDGSTVILNAHSVLTLPRFGFGRQSREVQLSGEASFSVKHTLNNQRFVVRAAKGVEVVVLGTEFNVNARPRGTQVILSRGKIQLNYRTPGRQSRQLLMRPGDLIRLDQTGKLAIRHGAQPGHLTAWQDHRFVFSQTSMAEIGALIKGNYNLTVKLKNPELAGRTVSGEFQAKNADEFLQVIAELLEVNYNRQENIVTFFD